MAHVSYDNLWRNEFYIKVSAKNRVQYRNTNHLKIKLNDLYRRGGKITTNSKASNDEIVINKAYLKTKLSKTEAQISNIQKYYKELKLFSNKLSVEEVLIERAVKTTIQTLLDKGLLTPILMVTHTLC